MSYTIRIGHGEDRFGVTIKDQLEPVPGMVTCPYHNDDPTDNCPYNVIKGGRYNWLLAVSNALGSKMQELIYGTAGHPGWSNHGIPHNLTVKDLDILKDIRAEAGERLRFRCTPLEFVDWTIFWVEYALKDENPQVLITRSCHV